MQDIINTDGASLLSFSTQGISLHEEDQLSKILNVIQEGTLNFPGYRADMASSAPSPAAPPLPAAGAGGGGVGAAASAAPSLWGMPPGAGTAGPDTGMHP